MKFVAGILCIIVIWLSVMPCCALDSASSSHAKTTITANSITDNCCANCSPFYSCGSCTGFTVPKVVQPELTIILTDAAPVYHHYTQPYIKEISLAIWQPPKLS